MRKSFLITRFYGGRAAGCGPNKSIRCGIAAVVPSTAECLYPREAIQLVPSLEWLSQARLRTSVTGWRQCYCIDSQRPPIIFTRPVQQIVSHAMSRTKKEGSRIDPDQELRSVMFRSLCVSSPASEARRREGSTMERDSFDQIKICKPTRAQGPEVVSALAALSPPSC